MRAFQYSITALFLMLAVGCAELGIKQPGTFNEQLAVEISAVTAARGTALVLLRAKKISADDAQNVQDTADIARVGIEVARGLSRTDMQSAAAKLNAVSTTLKAVTAYLATRK